MSLKKVALAIFVSAACTSPAAPQAFALGEPNNSKVEVSLSTAGKTPELTFKVVPNDGLVVTLDAPWKLELNGEGGLNFAKTTLSKADMNDKLPGFVVASTDTPKHKSGSVEYSLTSFVCTANKTACYREVHKGKYDWQTAGK